MNNQLQNPFNNENYLLKPKKRKNTDFNSDEKERLKEISALLSKIESELNALIGKNVNCLMVLHQNVGMILNNFIVY